MTNPHIHAVVSWCESALLNLGFSKSDDGWGYDDRQYRAYSDGDLRISVRCEIPRGRKNPVLHLSGTVPNYWTQTENLNAHRRTGAFDRGEVLRTLRSLVDVGRVEYAGYARNRDFRTASESNVAYLRNRFKGVASTFGLRIAATEFYDCVLVGYQELTVSEATELLETIERLSSNHGSN